MKPDRVVFNALITACGQSGAVDRAFDVLGEMLAETQPIEPDHTTVGALIRACANAGQVRFIIFLQKLQGQLLEIYGACSVSTSMLFLLCLINLD